MRYALVDARQHGAMNPFESRCAARTCICELHNDSRRATFQQPPCHVPTCAQYVRQHLRCRSTQFRALHFQRGGGMRFMDALVRDLQTRLMLTDPVRWTGLPRFQASSVVSPLLRRLVACAGSSPLATHFCRDMSFRQRIATAREPAMHRGHRHRRLERLVEPQAVQLRAFSEFTFRCLQLAVQGLSLPLRVSVRLPSDQKLKPAPQIHLQLASDQH